MKTGIYKIKNNINNKVYVGSSNDIDRRWDEHINMLGDNKHHSIKLQRAWNKYGEFNFAFEVIELCDKDILLSVEQKWIDNLDSYKNGYNCTASTTMPFKDYDKTKTIDKLTKCRIILLKLNSTVNIFVSDEKYYERLLKGENKKVYDYTRIIALLKWFVCSFDTNKYSLLLQSDFTVTTDIKIKIIVKDDSSKYTEFSYKQKDKTMLYHNDVVRCGDDITENHVYFAYNKKANINNSHWIGKVFTLKGDTFNLLDDEYEYFNVVYKRHCEFSVTISDKKALSYFKKRWGKYSEILYEIHMKAKGVS